MPRHVQKGRRRMQFCQESLTSSPPPLPPPASPPSDCEELLPPHFLYFQRQQQAHCGMHALNNALGHAAFTPENMAEAAAQYLQEHVGIDEERDEHIRPGGWYSAHVLYAALFVQGYGLNLDEPIRTIEKARSTPSMVQNWGNWHWVVYRRGPTGKLFLLNSLQREPKEVTEQQFLGSLGHCWTYAVKAWYLFFGLGIGWLLAGYWLGIGWLLADYWLAIGWLLAGYWLDVGWLLAGYWLDVGWLLAGYWLDVGWLLAGYWLDVGWLLAGYWLAIGWLLGGCWLDVGWLLAGYWLAFGWLLAGSWPGFRIGRVLARVRFGRL
eukprot:Skav208528  [mRNA]  locus=scaffold5369:9608:11607:- [translate_table: standard]